MVQALVVLLSELVALLALVTTTVVWHHGDVAAAVVTFFAGAISRSAIISLAVQEAKGAALRAACLKEALDVGFPLKTGGMTHMDDLSGTTLLLSETMFVVARTGYSPQRLFNLTLGASVIFVCSSAALAVAALLAARRRRAETAGEGAGSAALPAESPA